MDSQMSDKQRFKEKRLPTYAIDRLDKRITNRSNYNGNENQLVCGRFPHMEICACEAKC